VIRIQCNGLLQMPTGGGILPRLIFEDAGQIKKVKIVGMRRQQLPSQRPRQNESSIQHQNTQVKPLRFKISGMKPQ
jgi:hypothetical protein